MKPLASTFRNAGLTVIRSNPRWVTGGKPRPTRFCKFWSTYNLGRSKRLEECWSTYPLASLEANSFEKLANFARENFFAIFELGWPQMTLTPDFLIICILCVKFELRPKMTQKFTKFQTSTSCILRATPSASTPLLWKKVFFTRSE